MEGKNKWEKDHICPVCGRFHFAYENDLDMCDVCGWSNDAIQERNPNYRGGGNEMSLNEAKEAHQNNQPIY